MTKTCYRCKRELPASSHHFHKNCARHDGLATACRDCAAKLGIERRKTTRYRKQVNDPLRRLRHSLSSQMRRCVGNVNGRRIAWMEQVPWTFEQLAAHLERQFTTGMTWANYGKWHLDHIKPLHGFDIPTKDSPGFHACWALSNLQPLWAYRNLVKGKSSFANLYFDEMPEWEVEKIQQEEEKARKGDGEVPF